MWRNKSCCTIYMDVCLRIPKRSSSTTLINQTKTIRPQKSNEELRILFEQYAKRNKLSPTDWYQLSSTSLDDKIQKLISKQFGGSFYRALSTVFPEIEWKPWNFKIIPQGYWNEKANQRKFFDWLGKQLEVQTLDDWYSKLSQHAVINNGGRGLLRKFTGSPIAAIMAAYPDYNWIPWKFTIAPHGYWNDTSNQRKFFDELGKQLGVNTLDDWYSKLSMDVILSNRGRGLLGKHSNSPTAALMAAYPEHNWIPWKFNVVPTAFWDDISNHRRFFDYLGKQLGIQTLDDWYSKLSADAIITHGGSGLLNNKYNSSPTAALMAVYPEHTWIPWKFNMVPLGYWNNKSNQRRFFDELGKQLGVQTLDDWYDRLSYDLLKYYGGGLLRKYKDSPMAALMAVYPEHNWIPWRFNLAQGFWKSKHNVKKFLNELSEKLSIQTLDDWYLVSVELLNQFGAYGLVQKYKGLHNLLKEHYPHHPWDPNRFKQIGRKTQRWLVVNLKKIFPDEGNCVSFLCYADNTEILQDYMHPEAVFPSSNRPIQLDIYLPSRSLAFEYQGVQHYQDIGIFSPTKNYQHRDEEKRALCAANNIKLIEVPYWWNRTRQSLEEIIHKSLQ